MVLMFVSLNKNNYKKTKPQEETKKRKNGKGPKCEAVSMGFEQLIDEMSRNGIQLVEY